MRWYQGAIIALALSMLGLLWGLGGIGTLDTGIVLLATALGALICIGDRTELPFRFGGETMAATSATVPLLVAALYLPPVVAGTVALLGYLVVELRPRQALRASFGAGGSALALVAASTIARGLAGGAPAPELALVAGAAAAMAFEVVYTGAGVVMLELRRRGAAREFVPDALPIIVVDVVLGIVGVVVVAPFGGAPWTLLAVLVAFQLVAHAGLVTLNREQEQRGRANMLQRTFSRYVPQGVVQQLIDSGDEVELGGEARDVTVLFCDIRDFTSWAERTDPADVIADLNELLGMLAQCVFETEGTLDKYTGDGLMAFWGAPAEQADHASRAVRAALRFEEALRDHNERRSAAGHPPMAIGVGVHSGSAIVGNVGHAERHDYTAIGDTVNVAARLEAASKQLGAPIVISGATRARLSSELQALALAAGTISVKGRDAELEVHTLSGSVDLTAAA
jgi:class 3 adenylate cyclase